jgi:hypothetical protein
MLRRSTAIDTYLGRQQLPNRSNDTVILSKFTHTTHDFFRNVTWTGLDWTSSCPSRLGQVSATGFNETVLVIGEPVRCTPNLALVPEVARLKFWIGLVNATTAATVSLYLVSQRRRTLPRQDPSLEKLSELSTISTSQGNRFAMIEYTSVLASLRSNQGATRQAIHLPSRISSASAKLLQWLCL